MSGTCGGLPEGGWGGGWGGRETCGGGGGEDDCICHTQNYSAG